ncbi:hypothetical protein N431DRAFT_210018 [Stipitochalara longipes BDJ]|nr:hypothetical protein N431DRAFT_210018 [Stipitochalara longipes BDJ]
MEDVPKSHTPCPPIPSISPAQGAPVVHSRCVEAQEASNRVLACTVCMPRLGFSMLSGGTALSTRIQTSPLGHFETPPPKHTVTHHKPQTLESGSPLPASWNILSRNSPHDAPRGLLACQHPIWATLPAGCEITQTRMPLSGNPPTQFPT